MKSAMKTKLLAIALVLLAGCNVDMNKPFLQCVVDDSLSFTTGDVRTLYSEDSMLIINRRGDLSTLRHNMLPGETCERVAAIQWELAP